MKNIAMAQETISCQLCSHNVSAQRPFYCLQCARSRLYEVRLHHAQTLLDREASTREIDAAYGQIEASPRDDSSPNSSGQTLLLSRLVAQREQAQQVVAETTEACGEIIGAISHLRESVAERRKHVQQREQAIARRKDASSARGLRDFDPLPGTTRKVETDWVRLYNAIAEDRQLLCTEAANLYGLELRRKTRDARAKDLYYLGDVPVVDIRELNTASHQLVTVSLGRVAHLLHLTSHYLSLQLPAEITLPSSSQPHTLIHTPSSSYKDPSLPSGQRQAAVAPRSTRQRSLNLEKPLAQLATEDQVSYALFVEAVTLLAWDIAWLAKSQGIEIGVRHWDEVCCLGRNLWLLFGPQARKVNKTLSPTRTTSYDASSAPVSAPMARTSSGGVKRPAQLQAAPAAAGPITPGRLSHNSAFAFLPASVAVGGSAEVFRGWSFANPIRLIERVKAALANERMGAEWEVLEKEEWEGLEAHDNSGDTTPMPVATEPPSSYGAARMRGLLLGRLPSQDTHGTSTDDERRTEAQGERKGWLRVRSKGEGPT